ncbi:MAG: DUF4406 domain-containing protein [Bacteroidales bacterium]|nr:DUF4406 domain-containing protein [Bacteroidales bacterium]
MKMNNKPRIFISGKISGLNYYYAYNKFAMAEKRLEKMGYKVINPMCKCNKDWNWLRCMIVCLYHLLRCKSFYQLDNWMYSRGARIEYRIARFFKKDIIQEKY